MRVLGFRVQVAAIESGVLADLRDALPVHLAST